PSALVVAVPDPPWHLTLTELFAIAKPVAAVPLRVKLDGVLVEEEPPPQAARAAATALARTNPFSLILPCAFMM
ncbi:MAG TPA: hypothetical protein VJ577_19235, partial [Burkholderiaceae bacterium]|nr:hypothetical protein [Burkholderiaceae bacterium]